MPVLRIVLAVFPTVVLLSLCCAQNPAYIPEANPARPTIATPATLTPVGYLQFESGILGARNSPEFSTLTQVNETVKLTVHRRLQFLLQTAPLAYSTDTSSTNTAAAEAFLGAQGVLFRGEGVRPTISLSYLGRVHDSGGPDLDIGSPRQTALILLSNDIHGFHADWNAIFSEQVQQGIRRAQFGQTLSVSHPIGRVSLTSELWHFTQPFLEGRAMGTLWAVSSPLRKNLVVDMGFNRGLTSTSTKWEVFMGFTYLLPHRLWERHQERNTGLPGR